MLDCWRRREDVSPSVWDEKPPFTPDDLKKSPELPSAPFEMNDSSSVEEEDKSWAARVPAAIRAAAGASTAVIVCQDDGALDRSSTSPCCGAACWRSLAFGTDLAVVGELVVTDEAEVGAVGVVVDVVVVVVVVVGAVAAGFVSIGE